jgi:hypothetical protein
VSQGPLHRAALALARWYIGDDWWLPACEVDELDQQRAPVIADLLQEQGWRVEELGPWRLSLWHVPFIWESERWARQLADEGF